jgi:AcrR family transcriptional regulator
MQQMTSATRTYGGVTADDRRATRRAALIEAALDLFAEGGAHAVSKRAVCTRARLNDRYFYESFTDTNALLEAIVREQTQLGLEAVSTAAVEATNPHSQIRITARVALEFLTADPRRGALLLGSRGSEVLQRARTDSARAIAEAMSAIARDELGRTDASPLDSAVAAYALVSGAMEVIEAWLRGDFDTTREHLADLVAGLLAATPAITASLPNSSSPA